MRRNRMDEWWVLWTPPYKRAFIRLWNAAPDASMVARVFGLAHPREASRRARLLRREGFRLKMMQVETRVYPEGCQVPGCTRPRPRRGTGGNGRGMCPTHYMRWRRGDRDSRLARPMASR
jgi:hypothetical protein